jgi:hypothetical protein
MNLEIQNSPGEACPRTPLPPPYPYIWACAIRNIQKIHQEEIQTGASNTNASVKTIWDNLQVLP